MNRDKKLPLFSIVILNWNKIDDTLACLEHVRKLTYPNFEIVVVDNGSADGSKEILSKIDDIVFVDNDHNRGFTGGHIDGLKASQGEYIVLLNNDAVIKKDYLSIALNHFKDDETIGAVGGRAYWWNDLNPLLSENNSFYSFQTINPVTAEAISHQTDSGHVQEVNNVSGSCVVVKRSVIDAIGYLHEPFFAYYEETDLFARMKRSGYKILYDPSMAIWHKVGASSSSYFQYRQLFKNRFIFAVRNFDSNFLFPFLKSYIKTGVMSSVFRLKKTENHELHRAFSNAFLLTLLTWPKALSSRRDLGRQLGGGYNAKLVIEQEPISFVIDGDKADITSQWIEFIALHPRHELIITTKKDDKFNESYRNIRVAKDKGYFKSFGVNLGWLSAKNRYVYVINTMSSDLPNIYDLEQRVYALYKNNSWISTATTASLDNPHSVEGWLLDKHLLISSGGIEKNFGTITNNMYALMAYAGICHKSKLLDSTLQLALTVISEATDRNINSIKSELTQQVKRTRREDKEPSWWTRVLEKHYRVYQIRNVCKWSVSRKITLRLKLARTKNLVLFALTLRRKQFATELKHIRNEVIKTSLKGVDLEKQNKYIKSVLAATQDNWKDIPVFIICRDRLDSLIELIKWLEKNGMKKIVLIDNDSIYPPLRAFYSKSDYQVIYTMQNVGHTAPWNAGIIKSLVPQDFYIVTDPDVIPTKECPEDVIKHFLNIHKEYFLYQKVGFGLKIDDIPDTFKLKKSVVEWESQFWKQAVGPDIYEAGVDTTFAVYKPFTYRYTLHPSLRTGGNYQARHMPWYVNGDELSPEEIFYRARVNNKITSWNVDKLPERYLKELNLA